MVRIPPIIGALLLAVALFAANDPVSPDTAAFDCILKRYVLEDGTVKYAALKASLDPLTRFVQQIGAVSPESHPALFRSRAHKLAYWLNTYNALVLWAMAQEYPEKKDRLNSLIGRYQFFMRMKFKVGGRDFSLNDIETNEIRKRFQEPRIHFAIVCASRGCPWLSRDAYTGERLEEQLEARTKLFINQIRNVRVNGGQREISLSQIFQWYQRDFGVSPEAVLAFIRELLKKQSGKYATSTTIGESTKLSNRQTNSLQKVGDHPPMPSASQHSLHPRHCGLRWREQRLYLALHSFQRFH